MISLVTRFFRSLVSYPLRKTLRLDWETLTSTLAMINNATIGQLTRTYYKNNIKDKNEWWFDWIKRVEFSVDRPEPVPTAITSPNGCQSRDQESFWGLSWMRISRMIATQRKKRNELLMVVQFVEERDDPATKKKRRRKRRRLCVCVAEALISCSRNKKERV